MMMNYHMPCTFNDELIFYGGNEAKVRHENPPTKEIKIIGKVSIT